MRPFRGSYCQLEINMFIMLTTLVCLIFFFFANLVPKGVRCGNTTVPDLSMRAARGDAMAASLAFYFFVEKYLFRGDHRANCAAPGRGARRGQVQRGARTGAGCGKSRDLC